MLEGTIVMSVLLIGSMIHGIMGSNMPSSLRGEQARTRTGRGKDGISRRAPSNLKEGSNSFRFPSSLYYVFSVDIVLSQDVQTSI